MRQKYHDLHGLLIEVAQLVGLICRVCCRFKYSLLGEVAQLVGVMCKVCCCCKLSLLVKGRGAESSLTTVSGDLWKGVNFLRCCLLRNVTLPEPSMRTTYW